MRYEKDGGLFKSKIDALNLLPLLIKMVKIICMQLDAHFSCKAKTLI